MSYQERHNDNPFDIREAVQREHEEMHMGENIFDEKCVFCNAEKCGQCKGSGMNRQLNMICGLCNGRGRII